MPIDSIKIEIYFIYTLLEKWIKENVSKDSLEVHRRGMKKFVRWEGRIPRHIGKLIRDNCETLEFSIERGGASVEFKGLTFGVGHRTGGSRRRLLGGAYVSS